MNIRDYKKMIGLDYYTAKDGHQRPQFPRNLMIALHLRWPYLTVVTFKNWLQIYLHRFFSGDYILQTRSGAEFVVQRKEAALPIIVGIFHYNEYGTLTDVPRGSLIIDLGGNIGTFSIFALSRVPESRVYVYEPNPDSFDSLMKSIERNGFASRTVAVNKAVAGTEDMRTLYVTKSLNATDTLYDHRPGSRGIEVPCTTLAGIFRDNAIEVCDLLKVDVEGAEYEIFLNTPDDVLARIKKIVMEWHLIDARYGIEDLTNFLSSKGFIVEMDTPFRGILTATNSKYA